jgi:lipoate---protein ligase
MKYLELTFPTPQQNLACDEALLQRCEEEDEDEVLRFWEPREYFVVLGYSNSINSAVHLSACRAHRVPILRRRSGGGTILQGPGCLNYALVLKLENRPLFQDIAKTNILVMRRLQQALEPLLDATVSVQGFTDLALGTQKFSGNAQYRKRRALLFHGTFLLDFDIPLIEKLLLPPAKQPSYRQNRSHEEFLTNLSLSPAAVKAALKQSWNVSEELKDIPLGTIEMLVKKRYSTDDWNLRL